MKKRKTKEKDATPMPNMSELTIEYVKDPKRLKLAPYNARTCTPAQLKAIARSIVEFGIVQPFIARREDGLTLGGHQRLAAIDLLLEGPFRYRGKGGKTIEVTWSLPPKGLPVTFLEGISDRRAKLLNFALNRATGDWDHDKVSLVLKSLTEEVTLGEELTIDVFEIGVTGFTPAEITDYIDIATETIALDEVGSIPQPTQQAPKLTLDFSSKEFRDAVKSALGAQARENEPSGDALVRMLGVTPKARRSVAS